MSAAPPPVQVTLGAGAAPRWLAAGLVALAMAAMAAWLVSHGVLATPWAAPLVLLPALLAGWRSRPMAARLGWDGTRWWLQSPPPAPVQPVQVWVALDLGGALLLRCRGEAMPRWRWWWLGRAEAGAAWHGLRVALYHRGAASA